MHLYLSMNITTILNTMIFNSKSPKFLSLINISFPHFLINFPNNLNNLLFKIKNWLLYANQINKIRRRRPNNLDIQVVSP